MDRAKLTELFQAVKDGRMTVGQAVDTLSPPETLRPISLVDRRRLQDGARALALPEAKTETEIREHLEIIHDGLVALQSTDDLGDELNIKVQEDMDTLQERYRDLRRRLKHLDELEAARYDD